MNRKIKIFDTTLRDGEQSPGCSMDLSEKLEVARQLEKLGVDVIEAGFAIASPGDLRSVQAIASEVKNARIASLARSLEKDIDAAWEGVKSAVSPMIHVFIATSPVHMLHKLRMEPDAVVKQAVASVKYARRFCSDVEFSCEDACRSEPAFLVRILGEVIRAGATVLNIPDTVGYTTPAEMQALISYLMTSTPGIEKCDVSVHCHDDLGMAVANSLAAVSAGATQVECTINGIGERAGNAALEEVVMALHTRKELFGADSSVDTKQIYRASRLISSITGVNVAPSKAVVGANAFAHEAGIHQHGVMAERTTYEIMTPQSIGIPENRMVLGKHSGKHAFEERLGILGYHFDAKKLGELFDRFKELADKKKVIMDRDLEALVDIGKSEHPGRFRLDRFIINSGNTMGATARLRMFVGEEEFERVELGDGPVDAAFKAINAVAGQDFILDDFSLQAVTEGEDALGEATVRLRAPGGSAENVTGRGVSTDIIEASLKAYINGVNKLMSE